MPNEAEDLILKLSNHYLQNLVDKMIYQLKRAPEYYRRQTDSSLKNLWEEICVQKQTDYWDGWYLTLGYLELQCATIISKQEPIVLNVLSFEFLHENTTAICEEFICEKLIDKLLETAINYTNIRIENYID